MSLAELAELGRGNRVLGVLPPEEYELLLPALSVGLENDSCECYRIIRTELDRPLPEGAPGYGAR